MNLNRIQSGGFHLSRFFWPYVTGNSSHSSLNKTMACCFGGRKDLFWASVLQELFSSTWSFSPQVFTSARCSPGVEEISSSPAAPRVKSSGAHAWVWTLANQGNTQLIHQAPGTCFLVSRGVWVLWGSWSESGEEMPPTPRPENLDTVTERGGWRLGYPNQAQVPYRNDTHVCALASLTCSLSCLDVCVCVRGQIYPGRGAWRELLSGRRSWWDVSENDERKEGDMAV